MQYTDLVRGERNSTYAGALLFVDPDTGEIEVRSDLVSYDVDAAAVKVGGTALVAVGVSLTIADVIAAAAGSRLLYTDADGKIQELPALTPGQILVADANGLPTGTFELTWSQNVASFIAVDHSQIDIDAPLGQVRIAPPFSGFPTIAMVSDAMYVYYPGSVSPTDWAAVRYGGGSGILGVNANRVTASKVDVLTFGFDLPDTNAIAFFLGDAGGGQQWQWSMGNGDGTAHLFPIPDNALDIGGVTATIGSNLRPRTIHAATSIVTPLLVLDGDDVTLGANDSAGTGYRLLRVPNAA